MDAMRKKRPRKATTFLLHQDNAPPHCAGLTQATLKELNIKTIEHPPYSPDLAPNDFFLFPTLKEKMRGKRFGSTDELPAAVNWIFRCIPR
ncbi:MAG: hypothetical protein AB2693_27060, partial [Candidatus Thiodiazotropha sp.]